MSGPSIVSQSLASNRLSTAGILFFAMSSVAPLTVVAGVIPTGIGVTGLVAVTAGMLCVALVLLMWAPGYVAMARHIQNAGAFYAYISKGLGRPAGVGAAWFALLGYNAFQVATYGGIGALAAPLVSGWVHDYIGMGVHWTVIATAAWALVAYLGRREVKVSASVLAVLVICEIFVVIAYSVLIVAGPNFHPSAKPLEFTVLFAAGGGALVSIGATAFAGIEQAAALYEEARDGARSVRRATYLTITVIAVIYGTASWVIVCAGGPGIVELARSPQAPDIFFNQAAAVAGAWTVPLGTALFLTSMLAALISFHGIISRYTFALGREGVLPRALGVTVGGAPRRASAVQSVIGLAVIVVYGLAGWDPLVQLFFWGGTTGGVAVLILITLSSLAVLGFFARHTLGETFTRRVLIPAIASAALLFVSYLAVTNLSTLYGSTSPARVMTIAGIAVFAFGTIMALAFKKFRPDTYRGIGLGALNFATTPAPGGFTAALASAGNR